MPKTHAMTLLRFSTLKYVAYHSVGHFNTIAQLIRSHTTVFCKGLYLSILSLYTGMFFRRQSHSMLHLHPVKLLTCNFQSRRLQSEWYRYFNTCRIKMLLLYKVLGDMQVSISTSKRERGFTINIKLTSYRRNELLWFIWICIIIICSLKY